MSDSNGLMPLSGIMSLQSSKKKNKGLTTGEIVAIVFAVLFVLFIIIVLIYFLVVRSGSHMRTSEGYA